MHNHLHSKKVDNFPEDDELDQQIRESVAGRGEYDSWLSLLSEDYRRRGLALPTGIRRQRMWNEHQRESAAKKRLQQRADRLRSELEKLGLSVAERNENPTQELDEPDFDAIDREIQRLQNEKKG
jgi:hypothetical protein